MCHVLAAFAGNKNPAAREMILKKVEGYMTRAEQIKKLINNGGASPAAEPSASGGGATAKGGGGGTGDAKGDAEQAKMRGALASTSPSFVLMLLAVLLSPDACRVVDLATVPVFFSTRRRHCH